MLIDLTVQDANLQLHFYDLHNGNKFHHNYTKYINTIILCTLIELTFPIFFTFIFLKNTIKVLS
jgi:hypothetical protein